MRRRDLLKLSGAAAAWPACAQAQQLHRLRLIGVLLLFADDASSRSYLAAFQQRLQESGWTEGQNIRIERRLAAGDTERLRAYATELVGLRPDIIICAGATPVTVLRQQSRSIPLVFAAVTDPVASGFVEGLAHPGGNITGFTNFLFAMAQKWLQLLKEIAPSSRRVGLFQNPKNADWPGYLSAAKVAAASHGGRVEITRCRVGRAPVGCADRFRRPLRTGAVTGDSDNPDHHDFNAKPGPVWLRDQLGETRGPPAIFPVDQPTTFALVRRVGRWSFTTSPSQVGSKTGAPV